MKYFVATSGAGTYGKGRAYKIYQIEDNKIVKPIAGVYFSMNKGREVKDKNIFDTIKEAKNFVVRDAIEGALNGENIYNYKKLANSLKKVKI